jgi:hypothetical protein
VSIDHLIKLLQHGTSHVSGSWILVMGGDDGSWQSLKRGLSFLEIGVVQAASFQQARDLIDAAQEPPLLAYLFADELGGLDVTISLHARLQKEAHISKCLIVSAEVSDDMDMFATSGSTSPMILSAPKRKNLN